MTNKWIPIVATPILGFVALGASLSASAAITVYNFQASSYDATRPTYVGQGALGQGGNFFNREVYTGGTTNQVGGSSGVVVEDSNRNAASGVTFTYTAPGIGSKFPSPTPATTDPGTLLESYATTTGTDDISLTGLAANTAYTAIFYGENGAYADGRVTTFTLTNSSYAALPGASNTANTTANSATSFTTNPGNYVTLSGTTDANGDIFATFTNNNTGGYHEGDFNALQVAIGSAAPEPSQIGMMMVLALGLGGLLLTAKKRNAQFKI